MNINRKYMLILGVAVLSVLSIIIIISLANSHDSTGQADEMNDRRAGEQALLQVGPTYITHSDLERYKDNLLSVGSTPLPDDSILLKALATKELMVQLAEEEGVAASLEDGIQEAKQLRETLKAQPQEIQNQHLRFMDEMGVSEEQYWGEIAPPEYRDMLSIEQLMSKLIADLKASKPDVIISMETLKQELLDTALAEHKVIVLNSEYQWR